MSCDKSGLLSLIGSFSLFFNIVALLGVIIYEECAFPYCWVHFAQIFVDILAT